MVAVSNYGKRWLLHLVSNTDSSTDRDITMPSVSYGRWITTRRRELDEIERAHTAIGGTGRGRRYATQQINHAYLVLSASQFQGYCRDLYTESVDYLVPGLTPQSFQASIRELLTQNLQLKRFWSFWYRLLDRGQSERSSQRGGSDATRGVEQVAERNRAPRFSKQCGSPFEPRSGMAPGVPASGQVVR
jgi:hypothetical protein